MDSLACCPHHAFREQAMRVGLLGAVLLLSCARPNGPVREAEASRSALSNASLPTDREESPRHWIEQLRAGPARSDALKRLEHLFGDALARAGDHDAGPVRYLVDELVEPLTAIYVDQYSHLDVPTRVALIRLLTSFEDRRAEPAIRKAFAEYAKHPSPRKEDADIKWAARATRNLALSSVAAELIQAFVQLRASTMLGGITYKDINEAMVAVPSSAWIPTLHAKLEEPIVRPRSAADRHLIDPYRDQLFWQATAAEVLGRLGDESSVRPLLKVLLDPSKGDVARTALWATTKLGEPTVGAASLLLEEQDEELIRFSQERAREVLAPDTPSVDRHHAHIAAMVLGFSGRRDAAPTMLETLAKERDSVLRAVIAREIARLPSSPETRDAFMAAFAEIPAATRFPPELSALEVLLESAAQFQSPEMVSWLLKQPTQVGLDPERRAQLQGAALVNAIKLALPEQLPEVARAVQRFGTHVEQGCLSHAERLLAACDKRLSCYLEAIQKPENQRTQTQFVAIKAAHMLAVLGNQSTAFELVAAVERIDNAVVIYATAQAIDHLCPDGSRALAEQLGQLLELRAAHEDRARIVADIPLKGAMYRIAARAK
jgi:hypothetical protein